MSKRRKRRNRKPNSSRARRRRLAQKQSDSLHFETLEPRQLLAGVTVGNATDIVDASAADLLSISTLIANPGTDGSISLREAITAANNDSTDSSDTIIFDTGVFGTAQTITLGGSELEITDSLTIDASALGSNVTINANSNSRVLNFSSLTGDLSLSKLTVTGGLTTGNGLGHEGGGIRFASTGTLSLTNSVVSNSRTQGTYSNDNVPYGGGIYSAGAVTLTSTTISGNQTDNVSGGGIFARGDVTLTGGSLVTNNHAERSGGGIFARGNNVMITDSTISDNSAGSSSDGGGIYTGSSTTLTVTNSTISGNDAGDNGGGVFSGSLFAGGATITGSDIFGNSAGFEGGGIYANRRGLILTDSTVSGNTSNRGGGVFVEYSGTAVITGSTISGNVVDFTFSGGGGLYADSRSNVTLTGSTVSGNSARVGFQSRGGGGILAADRVTLTLNSTTVTGNSTDTQGGGIGIRGGSVTLNLNNSIIAANTDDGTAPDIEAPDTLNVTYNLVGDNTGSGITEAQTADANGNLVGSSTGAGVIDPLLGPLQNNGGTTLTHAPQLLSPVIDAGNATEVVDQRGFLRPVEFGVIPNPAGGNGADIGAFELQNQAPVFTSPGIANVAENTQAVLALSAIDAALPTQTLTFAIAGTGADDGLFEINGSNQLRFKTLPDFETPLDTGGTAGDNVYEVNVEVSDGDGGVTSQAILVTVIDLDENLVVTTNDDALGPDGQTSLREAIIFANSNPGTDTIIFDTGVFGTAQTITLGGSELEITDSLTIDASALGSNVTINANSNSRVLNFSSLTGDLSLSKLTVTGGLTTGNGLGHEGGGIRFASTGTLSLTNSVVSNSRTQGTYSNDNVPYGGGIYSAGAVTLTSTTISGNQTDNVSGGGIFARGDVTLTGGSLVTNNHAERSGGGIFARGNNVMITDSTISDNSAGSSSDGGGIYTGSSTTLTVTNSTISGNDAGDNGGGVFSGSLFAGGATITGSDIFGNSAGFEGGGIYANRRGLILTDSTVSGNTSNRGGGVFVEYSGTAVITGSTISGNVVDFTFSGGGGLYADSRSNVTLTGSTVSGNSARVGFQSRGGGGILAADRVTLTLNSTTVTGNSTDTQGGGIGIRGGSVTLNLNNSIIAANTDDGTAPDIEAPDTLNVTYNLVGDNTGSGITEAQTADANGNLVGSSTGAGVIDPLLGPLQNNGGTTLTHAPQLLSPVIDAGDPAAVAGNGNTPLFDQRGTGFDRVRANIDIGAVEIQIEELPGLVVTTSSDVVDNTDFLTSLREAVIFANDTPGVDTVTFDAGVFNGEAADVIRLPMGELTISEAVHIDGGSTGVVISGDILGDDTLLGSSFITDVTASSTAGTLADNNGRVLNVTAPFGSQVQLSGLTITGGDVAGSGGGVAGGSADLLIENSVISGNRATNPATGTARGGGVYAYSGNVTINDSSVDNNDVEAVGGGVFALQGSVAITRSSISGNTSISGGGVYANTGNINVSDSVVADNVASGFAGGLLSVAGITDISGSSISRNVGGVGGGLLAIGPVSVTASTFDSNSSTGDGGGIIHNSSQTLTIDNSTFSGNTASGSGGGVSSNGLVSIESSTFTLNESASGGGGVNAGNSLTINNSIVAGNLTGTAASNVANAGNNLSGNFNLLGAGDLTGGANDLFVADNNPLLAPLADNGGPTRTHDLLTGSLAIDAGNSTLATDQRGLSRPVDNPNVVNATGGNGSDIGAVEGRESSSLIVTTASDVVDSTDFVISLREAITFANSQSGLDRITFDSTVFNGESVDVIRLGLGSLTLGSDIHIDGENLGIVISGDADGDDELVDGTFVTDIVASDAAGTLVDNVDRVITVETTGSNNRLTGLTITGGDSATVGGGISNSNAVLTIESSTIAGNRSAGNGGGIFTNQGNLVIDATTISENQSGSFGGGIFSNFGDPTLTNVTVSGNSSVNAGGGIAVLSAPVVISNSTIADNQSTSGGGGGISLDPTGGFSGDQLTLSNSIVARNVSNGSASDLFTSNTNSADIVTDFNLIGSNIDTGLAESQTPDANGNLVGGANDGIIDPLLAPLADNGGPTQTHALLAGSLALDAGNSTLATDQRGLARPVDFTSIPNTAGGNGSDIGAFELQNTAPVFTSPDSATVVENTIDVITLSATDMDVPAQSITFSIAGSGADNGAFQIVAGNQLQFTSAPDFELPADANSDNVYEVSVQADDGNDGTALQTILVTVTDVNDLPVFTSSDSATVVENTVDVITLSATDADVPAQSITFSIAGSGADNGAFQIVGGNQLQFTSAPDFELPGDANGDNVYEVTVQANDNNGGIASQTITVTLTNVAESLTLVVDLAADESDGDFSAGDLSLREAIELANANLGADTITFDATVFNGEQADVIRLQAGTLPLITESLHIDGAGQGVVISADANGDDVLVSGTFITDIAASDSTGTLGDNIGRVLDIVAPVGDTVQFTGLTITGGDQAGLGGGIISGASELVLENSSVSGNRASLTGGGIHSTSGNVTVTGSTISGNVSGQPAAVLTRPLAQ